MNKKGVEGEVITWILVIAIAVLIISSIIYQKVTGTNLLERIIDHLRYGR